MENRFEFLAEEMDNGIRLDVFLSNKLEDKTRQFCQKLIKEGYILVNKKIPKSGNKLKSGDLVVATVPKLKELDLKPVKMGLKVLYEDEDVVVIDKEAGIVVHPGVGDAYRDSSLVNALLYQFEGKLSGIGGVSRPGIVHRLDKDTSGCLLVTKNDKSHQFLMKQFQSREIFKQYLALVVGHLTPIVGSIESPIGRDPRDRKRMAVVGENKGKLAITEYEVKEYFHGYSLLKIHLLTGRTHQIRVHLSSIGFPIVGDATYGNEKINGIFKKRFGLKRQFLHANILKFRPSSTSTIMEVVSPLPKHLQEILDSIRD